MAKLINLSKLMTDFIINVSNNFKLTIERRKDFLLSDDEQIIINKVTAEADGAKIIILDTNNDNFCNLIFQAERSLRNKLKD